MAYLIRSAVLTNYVDVAQAAGLDPYRMLKAAGIAGSALLDPETKIPAGAVGRLLEASADASGAVDFGLRMAELRRLSNLGQIGLVVREQPTIRKALEALARYSRLHNESVYLRLEESDDLVIISSEFILGRRQALRQASELVVGVLWRTLGRHLGAIWEPQSVCFTHDAPTSLAAHRRVFGSRVDFSADFTGIVCLAKDLDAAIPASDPVMARHAQRDLEAALGADSGDTREQIREMIYALLGTGLCSVDRIARHLGVTRRTVHRHLAAQGETFSGIFDAVRVSLARDYVERRDRSLAEIAELLGFSGLSAFSRWFRDRFGVTARDLRMAARMTGDQRGVAKSTDPTASFPVDEPIRDRIGDNADGHIDLG